MKFKSSRISLEEITQEHADEMFEVLNDPKIYEYIPDLPPESIEALRNKYKHLAVGISPDGNERWLNWVVRDNTSKTLGSRKLNLKIIPKLFVVLYVMRSSWSAF